MISWGLLVTIGFSGGVITSFDFEQNISDTTLSIYERLARFLASRTVFSYDSKFYAR